MGVKLIVERADLIRNYLKMCDICKTEVIPVLKSNAYGMGILRAAQFFDEHGVKRIAVSRLDEAELLANSGIEAELMMLSSTVIPTEISRAISTGATLTAGSIQSLIVMNEEADRLETKVRAHLLIDTGFSHSGIREFEFEKTAALLPTLRRVTVTGIFTQFSESHNPKPLYTESQNERFEYAVKYFSQRIGTPLLVHAANSCAAIKYPETRYAAVRAGSALIGRLPAGVEAELHKVGYFECEIAEIKLIEKGEYIGYSRRYRTKKETKIAILPIGIADGLAEGRMPYGRKKGEKIKDALRQLKRLFADDRIYGDIGGLKVPVLGKISQSSTVVDITGLECEIGTKVRFEANPLFVPSCVEREYV